MDYDVIFDSLSANNHYSRSMGQSWKELSKGRAVIELEVKKDFLNPIHSLHGGALFGLADTVAGSACYTTGHYATTVTTSIHYMRPAREGDVLTAVGEVVKWGRRICFTEAKIYNQNDELLCQTTGSFMLLDPIPGAQVDAAE